MTGEIKIRLENIASLLPSKSIIFAVSVTSIKQTISVSYETRQITKN